MLSKKQEKFIRSLRQKKYRQQFGLFIVEGRKSVEELLQSELKIEEILGSAEELERLDLDPQSSVKTEELDVKQMKKLSAMSTSPDLMAIVRIPASQKVKADLSLYLDGVGDPGNMGTIIRTAEGFGVKQIYLSENCVDLFSPKVVQASMGSLFRLNYHILSAAEINDLSKGSINIYAADMAGDSIYDSELKLPALLIMGSEANGLSDESLSLQAKMLSIPIDQQLESLNVAISTAVMLAEFRRRFPL